MFSINFLTFQTCLGILLIKHLPTQYICERPVSANDISVVMYVLRPSPVYLLEIPNAVLATEAFLLAVHQQEVIGRGSAGQVVTTLLAAVHDQTISHAVPVEACIAADLVGHVLEAHLMSNL